MTPSSVMTGANAARESFDDIDFNAIQSIMTGMMDTLQKKFKEDTHYERPLMSPQGNVLFLLDSDIAQRMILYISEKLVTVGGFAANEFQFVNKCSANGAGLQRLRLDFTYGITLGTIKRIASTTKTLEEAG